MKSSRRYRALIFVAFALLGFSFALDVAQHIELLLTLSHSSVTSDHDFSKALGSENSQCHAHIVDHCHSLALFDEDFVAGNLTVTTREFTSLFSVPESPVTEIEYPPQLS